MNERIEVDYLIVDSSIKVHVSIEKNDSPMIHQQLKLYSDTLLLW